MSNKISNLFEISAFLHCKLCFDELPENLSLKDYTNYDIGYTKIGIQIWCKKHNCNVIHIDFNGNKFYADTTQARPVLVKKNE